MNTYLVPDTFLGIGDTNEIDEVPNLRELTFQWGKTSN